VASERGLHRRVGSGQKEGPQARAFSPTVSGLREREGETYRWPSGRDRYKPYRVFLGTTRAEGAVQVGLGETVRKNTGAATESTLWPS
jgi:hypothetical protein